VPGFLPGTAQEYGGGKNISESEIDFKLKSKSLFV